MYWLKIGLANIMVELFYRLASLLIDILHVTLHAIQGTGELFCFTVVLQIFRNNSAEEPTSVPLVSFSRTSRGLILRFL